MANKILIINLGGIGDILLSAPALKSLRNLYPDANISILVTLQVYDLAKSLSYINKAWIFHIRYGGVVSLMGLFKNLKTLLALRKKQFDVAINMRTLVSEKSAFKMKLLLAFINPKIKAGRDTEGRGSFFDIKVREKEKGEKYEMDYDMEIVRALGGNVSDRNIDFKIDDESVGRVSHILETEGIFSKDIIIGIHPGGELSRRWPIENFSRVIKEISKRVECKFVITGGREERYLADRLREMADGKIINMAGKITIKELCALIKRCNLYISNDTGPMHIAAILKIPLIAIFGPGDIIRFDPRNISDKAVVLYEKIVCAPCEKVKCRDLKCLKMISHEEVIKVTLELLGRKV